ncbi:hypothetical protein vBEcoS95_33 [Escherichia phage vB_EcoS-95]|uniref:Uncharacterized protein n=1 Tax=Escherichia phage vB_EcoS-95 TaxID=2026130 RepID=A0A3Q8BR55_9CAUD|nr:hypothetical protein HOU88_gp32 [Escherichia phage vB_EcoS-95]ASV44836.1 hypothetical protein vBEcoS95_33 [Escherichia phage vB_EcoS-95]
MVAGEIVKPSPLASLFRLAVSGCCLLFTPVTDFRRRVSARFSGVAKTEKTKKILYNTLKIKIIYLYISIMFSFCSHCYSAFCWLWCGCVWAYMDSCARGGLHMYIYFFRRIALTA